MVFLPIWVFFISPKLTALTIDTSEEIGLIHTENNRFDIGGEWSGNTISFGDIKKDVVRESGDNTTVNTSMRISSLTNDTLFELKQTFYVDLISRHNLPGGNDPLGDAYYTFPANTGKTEYLWRPSTLGTALNVSYQDSQAFGNTLSFHFHGDKNDVDDTSGYDFLPLVPEKYKVLSRVSVDVFVEPITGIVLDYRDSGVSYYATSDGKPVSDIAEWSNRFNEETVGSRITRAQSLKTKYVIIQAIMPLILFLSAIVSMAFYLKDGKKTISSGSKK